MHSEIKKFWEQVGPIDTDSVLSAPVSQKLWCVYPEGNIEYDSTKKTIYIAHKNSDSEDIVYYWNGNTYNEEYMLKVIKLKAFT